MNYRHLCSLLCVATFAGCRQGMYDQPKGKPLASSDLFPDGSLSRPLAPHVIPANWEGDDPSQTGMDANGVLLEELPVPATLEIFQRGRERYNIFCSECHDQVGTGNGMIVQRGFPNPPSFHIDRLRQAPIGHFYDVITHGYGAMYSYASRVPPQDRWAIAAYIRALQLSQNARPEDAPAGEMEKLSPHS